MSVTSKGSAVVTGGGQGIGRGIALQLAKDGYDVAVNELSSNADAARRVVEEISSEGKVRELVVLGDVPKEEDVKEIIAKAVAEFGGLNVVCWLFDFLSCSFISLLSKLAEETNWNCASIDGRQCRMGTILSSMWRDLLREGRQIGCLCCSYGRRV
jgi:NAD(P)-dependent dehydrogenase (short-subunit alcohol dehydrogenase family)